MKSLTLLTALLLLVMTSAANGYADRDGMDGQSIEEDALIQSLLSQTVAQGKEILSAIEQHMSKLQDDEDEPSIQAVDDPLSESQDDPGNGDELSSQAIEDPLSESQDDEDPSKQALFDLLAGVQDEDDESLNDLADIQDDDDDDVADIQTLQKLLKATQEDIEDPRVKRAAEEQAPVAKIQWWVRKHHFNNHQRHYYNAFVNVARSYMRHNYNNKRSYQRALRSHMDRSYNNFIAQMNGYFKGLFKKIENNIPRYVQSTKDAKSVLKELSNGGKKLPKKAIVIEEPPKKTTSKVHSKKGSPSKSKKVKG